MRGQEINALPLQGSKLVREIGIEMRIVDHIALVSEMIAEECEHAGEPVRTAHGVVECGEGPFKNQRKHHSVKRIRHDVTGLHDSFQPALHARIQRGNEQIQVVGVFQRDERNRHHASVPAA